MTESQQDILTGEEESYLDQFSDVRRPRQKASDREVATAYLSFGSVWDAAKVLGMVGQSVHERVLKLGVAKPMNVWTAEEIEQVRALYESGFKSGDGQLKALSKKINRTVSFISRKARELGLSSLNRKCDDSLCDKFSEQSKRYIKEKGHPRGALGMKHSEETKATLSEKSRERWKNFSDEQIAEIKIKAGKTAVKNGTWARPRHKTTWKQAWREIGGKRNYYRSRWEANYARYLDWLKCAGEIIEWEHEPDTFWFEGVKRGTVSYLPDFKVIEKNGSTVYHEVKGWMDDRSKTKLKRMKKYHPDVQLIVIDSKAYKALTKKIGGMIDGWE
jgi:hypothetical protein